MKNTKIIPLTDYEKDRIDAIMGRVIRSCPFSTSTLEMIRKRIERTHKLGCGLRLKELYKADDLDFEHDIDGILNCCIFETGEMKNLFLPRFHGKRRVQ